MEKEPPYNVFIDNEGNRNKRGVPIPFFIVSLFPTKLNIFCINIRHPFSFQRLSMDSDPPFCQTYKALFDKTSENPCNKVVTVEECELPLVDLSRLDLDESEMEECKREIAMASQEWGFFQVINHGISRDILEKLREEQVKVFRQSFDKKSKEEKFATGCYRWGTPSATCLQQLSWSEAFHIPMTGISDSGAFSSLRYFYKPFMLTRSNFFFFNIIFAYFSFHMNNSLHFISFSSR